jgi:hypothetical protein
MNLRMKSFEIRPMVAHSPPILADRPEMFYRLQVVFPNELFS